MREELRPVDAPPQPALVATAPVPTPAPLRPTKEQNNTGRLAELQRSITRIYEACQAPPLPPSEYQVLFALIAAEVREKGFTPERTAAAVVTRAGEAGLKLSAKDVSFVIDAVDEVDPWLEHTRSPSAVARAYRDYVLSRCSQAGVQLSDDEYQLVQVWFGANQWNGNTPAPTEQASANPAAELPRRLAAPEPSLPAPNYANTLPPLPDFGDEIGLPEQEQQASAQPAKPSPLRYSFLKHG
jgi:hypothetical protein